MRELGLKKGDRVGILSQNCYEFVLLYGAVARLGAVMLPINWRLTSAVVQYILSNALPPGKDGIIRAIFESWTRTGIFGMQNGRRRKG